LVGDGSDGDVVVDTVADLVLTSDMQYANVTVDSGATLYTSGFVLRVSGTLINNGTITDTASGGARGPLGSGGLGGYEGVILHNPPEVGLPGSNGSAAPVTGGGHGGRGGPGGGGGGGAWQVAGTHNASGGSAGRGGLGGKGGGVVEIYANNVVNNSVIHANGEDGGNGQDGGRGAKTTWSVLSVNYDLAGGGGGGGAGGHGGDGGSLSVFYVNLTNNGLTQAKGGGAGAKGAGGLGRNLNYVEGVLNLNREQGALGGDGAENGDYYIHTCAVDSYLVFGTAFGGESSVTGGCSKVGRDGAVGDSGASGTVVLTQMTACYADSDNDGFGDANDAGTLVVGGCDSVSSDNNTDCDDSNGTTNPNGVEVCDGLDNNCDGSVDEGFAASTWYEDADGDGFGASGTDSSRCDQPPGYVDNTLDCDDGDAGVNPGTTEVCGNSTDDNCDTNIDEDCCPVVVTGDVNIDDNLTSSDIIYLVNHVFKGGPDPLPIAEAGDTDCSGAVTSSDIIQMVNHVFKGGPAPCDICSIL